MPRVLFTGGGTAGHVTPNIALLEAAIGKNWDVAYVGSTAGIEREMIGVLGIPYYAVASGKLRRYFSWQNFIDPFFILWGMLQSLVLCLRLRPDVVFSKGGFVAVPLVVAAWLLRVPVISHESDVTPGLANRLTYPFCRKICVTFEATKRYLPGGKVNVTGTPVRQSLVAGDAAAGLKFLGFSGEKPVLLVFGGALGRLPSTARLAELCRGCSRRLMLFMWWAMAILRLLSSSLVRLSTMCRKNLSANNLVMCWPQQR